MQWEVLGPELVAREPWVPAAVEAFRTPDRNPDAASVVADWLALKGADPETARCWVLLDDQSRSVRAFHTEEKSEAIVDEIRSGTLVDSLHASMAGRAEDAHGGGQQIVLHLCDLAREAGLSAVTVDPLDKQTERPWQALGLKPSLTPIDEGVDVMRHYLLVT